jgi:hypothetical protein
MDEPDESDLMEATFLTSQGRQALRTGDGLHACELLSKKHAIVLRAFGPSSGDAGTSLIDLPEALYQVGRFADARAAIDEALVIYEQLERTDSMRDRLDRFSSTFALVRDTPS